MKRFLFISLLTFMLAGCSGLPVSIPFLQTPLPPAPPQATATPYSLPPLLSSNTPDLFVINTAGPTTTPPTGTPLVTDTALATFTPTFRPTITLEPLDPTLFTPSPNLFLNVQRNTSQLVWGGTCAGDRSIRFVASTPAELAANPLYHGFLQRDGYAWRLSDGTPFLAVGDTQWSFAEELFPAEFEAWMDVLRIRYLNTVHGTAWLALYTRGGLSPFYGAPEGDILNPDYFKRLDRMIEYANDQGIMVGLCIAGFPGNSAWWTKLNTQARDDRWCYIVARYAALNVRWVLYGEVNEANPPWGTWQTEVSHKAALVKAEDPYRHPVGSHHTTVGNVPRRETGEISRFTTGCPVCGRRWEGRHGSRDIATA